jgi:hypothetical protein
LDNAALHLVDLLRQTVDLHAQLARGLVNQVDRLIGEEAVADVAVRESRGGDQRIVGNPDAVVDFVLLLETAQNRDGIVTLLAYETG